MPFGHVLIGGNPAAVRDRLLVGLDQPAVAQTVGPGDRLVPEGIGQAPRGHLVEAPAVQSAGVPHQPEQVAVAHARAGGTRRQAEDLAEPLVHQGEFAGRIEQAQPAGHVVQGCRQVTTCLPRSLFRPLPPLSVNPKPGAGRYGQQGRQTQQAAPVVELGEGAITQPADGHRTIARRWTRRGARRGKPGRDAGQRDACQPETGKSADSVGGPHRLHRIGPTGGRPGRCCALHGRHRQLAGGTLPTG